LPDCAELDAAVDELSLTLARHISSVTGDENDGGRLGRVESDVDKIKTEVTGLREILTAQRIDVKLLNWRVGLFSTIAACLASGVVAMIVKYV